MGDAPLESYLAGLRQDIDRGLLRDVARQPEGRVSRAMSTALTTPGKRLRPIATILAGEMFGVARERLLPFGMAVEMVHTASLLLDDLPCMDDAPLRRGVPALHREIGEADAILCAFALISRAFPLAATVPLVGRRERDVPVRLVALLAEAMGARGMCEGQSLDLAFEGDTSGGLAALEEIHRLKTGALFAAALQAGGLLGGAREQELAALLLFGKNLGLAFQVADDLLDHSGDAARLGKPAGTDQGRRLTFVSLFGVAASEGALHDLHRTARESLALFGKRARRLEEFADYLEHRDA